MLLTDRRAIGLQHLETGGLLLHVSMVLFTAEKCTVCVLDMGQSLSILYCGDFSEGFEFCHQSVPHQMDRLHDCIMCRLLALLYICGYLAFCSFERSFVIRCCELPFSPFEYILAGPLVLMTSQLTKCSRCSEWVLRKIALLGKKSMSLIACEIAE